MCDPDGKQTWEEVEIQIFDNHIQGWSPEYKWSLCCLFAPLRPLSPCPVSQKGDLYGLSNGQPLCCLDSHGFAQCITIRNSVGRRGWAVGNYSALLRPCWPLEAVLSVAGSFLGSGRCSSLHASLPAEGCDGAPCCSSRICTFCCWFPQTAHIAVNCSFIYPFWVTTSFSAGSWLHTYTYIYLDIYIFSINLDTEKNQRCSPRSSSQIASIELWLNSMVSYV